MSGTRRPEDRQYGERLSNYLEEYDANVEGWGLDDDLANIFLILDATQKGQGTRGNIAEIGVHHGRMFILLALLCEQGEKAVAVDLFEDQARNIDNSGRGNLGAFRQHLSSYVGDQTEIILVFGDSFFIREDAARENGDFRLFHIDGGHWPNIVANDLALAERTVCPGGIICVDDFLHAGFPGVMEGVFHYFNRCTSTKLVPLAVGMNKLFLTTYSFEEGYMRAIKSILNEPRGRVVQLMGHDCLCLDPH